MKIFHVCLILMVAVVSGVDVRVPGALHDPNSNNQGTGEDQDLVLVPQENRNGWVNPEDIPAMPQCIAQQDQSAWLGAMSKCTRKRCTRHFGIICTHHQWLTQLSCLSVEFTPDIIAGYFNYCSRSTLAKAQLYHWVRSITSRRWMVNVGDGNGLDHLTSASLAKGYAAVDAVDRAPTCLIESSSVLSLEAFQHVIASCGFTGSTQHTGNAARPWEYNERRHSMVALDSETVGYDMLGTRISDGDYFDKDCFCSTYAIDLETEPCSGSELLELTKERLWIHATCGSTSTSLPPDWIEGLKTTRFAYIPSEDWHWPSCVADMPQEVLELPNTCATDACEPDSSGYCVVKRAVDRACVCRNITYESYGGSCHIFETRIDNVNWLHDLCGQVPGWQGLPWNWDRTLAVPKPVEMIPWPWTIKPENNPDTNYRSTPGEKTCVSNERKLGSFATLNIAIILVAFLIQRWGLPRVELAGDELRRHWQWHLYNSHTWLVKGTLIAGTQLLANLCNVLLVAMTPGYKNVPAIQLLLLWCSIPRPAWIAVLLLGLRLQDSLGTTTSRQVSAAASIVVAEMILQFISGYYMLTTIQYGLDHDFYFGRLNGLDGGRVAETMYAGALIWAVVIGLALVQGVRATRNLEKGIATRATGNPRFDQPGSPPTGPRDKQTQTQTQTQTTAGSTQGVEEQLLGDHGHMARDDTGGLGGYGTFSVQVQREQHLQHWMSMSMSMSQGPTMYAAIVIVMLLLWTAQWLFWGGYIGLSSGEFCPPKLGILTAVWIASSVVGVFISVA